MSKTKHLSDYLARNAAQIGTKPAIICTGRTLSWSELAREVGRAADALSKHLGSDKQQVVGLLFPNTWEYVVAYLAILQTGHIVLPLDPTYKELELDAITRQVRPELVITNSIYGSKISYKNIYLLDELLAKTSGKIKTLRLDPAQQIASLTFTSGTTGKPKLAPYTHANHIWNIEVCSDAWSWGADDTLLLSLPQSHWYALTMGISGALYHGNTVYIDEWFDPEKTLEQLASGNISFFQHFPLAYEQMLGVADTKSYDLTKVRVMISGGAPLAPALNEQFKKRFGAEILETYGTSESGRIAANTAGDHLPGSAGLLLDDVKLKLSSTGEVLVKSSGVFPGYYHNPEATAANLDTDGWWHTGDIGELKGRRLFLKGRIQEKIRRFGYSLSPRDIEWALLKFPKIKAVHVMGRQRAQQPNDELVYFIDGRATIEQIRDYCKANLPYAWRPDRIILLDSMPRTRSGKTRLSALNAMLEEHFVTAGGSH
ncbi:MAG: class I adenylate-forming enzyme family protein [Candidatus Saccharimonadales bacterium]|jgi:long-chain acyl-CoA synthetase